MPNPQPTLPPEGVYTNIEKLFITEQPKNLWPENQNSNFGLLRRVLVSHLQYVMNMLTEMYIEHGIDTSAGYLGRWEEDLGLPKASSLPLSIRRALVRIRREIGPFTTTRVKKIVELLISATFGPSLEITPPGIPMVSEGQPLFSGITSLEGSYQIIWKPETYSYEILLVSGIGITPFLERELKRITPAGMTFTITERPAPLWARSGGMTSASRVGGSRP